MIKRYNIDGDCDGGHIAADMIIEKDKEGEWMSASEVLDFLRQCEGVLSDSTDLSRVKRQLKNLLNQE